MRKFIVLIAFVILGVSLFALSRNNACAGDEYDCESEVVQTPSSTPDATPSATPLVTATPTPQAQACNRSCSRDEDCRALDHSYICTKDQVCRLEGNPDHLNCEANPTATPSSVITVEELRKLPAGVK